MKKALTFRLHFDEHPHNSSLNPFQEALCGAVPGHCGHSHRQPLPAPRLGAAAAPAGRLHQAVTEGGARSCLGRSRRGRCPGGRRSVRVAVIKPNGRKRDNPQRRAGRRKGSFPEEWSFAQGFPGGALGTATEIRKLQQISPVGEQDILLRGKTQGCA